MNFYETKCKLFLIYVVMDLIVAILRFLCISTFCMQYARKHLTAAQRCRHEAKIGNPARATAKCAAKHTPFSCSRSFRNSAACPIHHLVLLWANSCVITWRSAHSRDRDFVRLRVPLRQEIIFTRIAAQSSAVQRSVPRYRANANHQVWPARRQRGRKSQRMSAIRHGTLRIKASESSRIDLPRAVATKLVASHQVGFECRMYARISERVCVLASEYGRTDSFCVADGGAHVVNS